MSGEKKGPFRFGLKRWRRKIFWVLVGLIVLEFPLIVSFLTLVGISDPNTYRTKLWGDGYLNGFNSSPDEPLYAAANYKPSFTPLVWSSQITTFNLVTSILCTFVLILKIILMPFHILWPWLSFLIHGLEAGLYAYSIYGQTSPDTLDPEHPNPGLPWYLTNSCSVAHKKSNEGFCQQAKATFFVAIFLLALMSVHVLLAIHAMFFAPAKDNSDQDTNFMTDRFPKLAEAEQTYEVPYTPRTPYTPYAPYSARDWEMDRIPPTPGTTGGMKSPFYAPHAGYATQEAAAERERGVSQFGFASGGEDDTKYGQAVPMAHPPVTPRTKAFQALDGVSNPQQQGGSTLKAEWGKRETGNMPWSGRNSGGSNPRFSR